MLKTLLVYLHLIATCAAIGTIVITDMRLAAKALGYKVVIPPPERFETIMVSAALLVLYCTGAAIIYLGWYANPDYLLNEKLHASQLPQLVPQKLVPEGQAAKDTGSHHAS